MRKQLTSVLAATVAAGAVSTATAFAHTQVKSTTPGAGKTASTRITAVSVTFTATIRSGSIKVTGPGGTVSQGSGGRDPRNVKRLRVPLKGSKRAGAYTARWTMKAADGHTQSGSFKFKLK